VVPSSASAPAISYRFHDAFGTSVWRATESQSTLSENAVATNASRINSTYFKPVWISSKVPRRRSPSTSTATGPTSGSHEVCSMSARADAPASRSAASVMMVTTGMDPSSSNRGRRPNRRRTSVWRSAPPTTPTRALITRMTARNGKTSSASQQSAESRGRADHNHGRDRGRVDVGRAGHQPGTEDAGQGSRPQPENVAVPAGLGCGRDRVVAGWSRIRSFHQRGVYPPTPIDPQ
jgi:hypothetical protein